MIVEVGGVPVLVLGFQGPHGHLFALTDPARRPSGPVTDAHLPWPDLGYIWIREDGGMWVASGNVVAGPVAEHIERVVDRIAEDLMRLDDQLSISIEVVGVRQTYLAGNEEGPRTFDGSRRHDG